MKLISWNIAYRQEPWRRLLDIDADIALLQEAGAPPPDVASRIEFDDEPWQTFGVDTTRYWRAAVVRLTDKVKVDWLKPFSIESAPFGELAVSRRGTLAAAVVTAVEGTQFTVVSMYGLWEYPYRWINGDWKYADASVHRLISDLAGLIKVEKSHRILAAGDLNILHGYGEDRDIYWAERYATVFSRMQAMGLRFVGPQAPNGRYAEPWPEELPIDSMNVPTFHSNKMTPAQAKRQLDFVFASPDLAKRMRVRALNEPENWGPSDHCRVLIDLE